MPLCQVSLTLVPFNVIILNLMYGVFDRGNYVLSDIYVAMLHESLSFGWLAYLEVGRGSWICRREQVEAVGGSIFKVSGAPN